MESLRRAVVYCFVLASLPLLTQQLVAQQHAPTVSEQYLLVMVNQERTQRDLPQLAWDEHLAAAAQHHAQMMAQQGAISHQFPGEPELQTRAASAGARFHLIAENVAMAGSPQKLHDAWMHSPGHRANILQPQENAIGIAVVQRGQQLWAVEDFSTRVVDLDLNGQEKEVVQDLKELGIDAASSDAARQSCPMETGYAGSRMPYFVMRYTTSDLTALPTQLKARIAQKKLHHAEVGACKPAAENFTNFNVAVLLFP